RCEVKTEALPVPRSVPAKTPAKAKTRSLWMEGFNLQGSPPLWKTLSPEAGSVRGLGEPAGIFVSGANLSRPTGSFG
ncbi:MAG: hypothetical protein ACRD1N_03165, partial [Terriglobia bacterium]